MPGQKAILLEMRTARGLLCRTFSGGMSRMSISVAVVWVAAEQRARLFRGRLLCLLIVEPPCFLAPLYHCSVQASRPPMCLCDEHGLQSPPSHR